MTASQPGGTTRPALEFYFDFTCPFAYLASTQIEAIARQWQAHLRFCPMLLGGVFRSIGDGTSPMSRAAEAKAGHTDLDMARFAARLGVPLTRPAGHPLRSVRALRALLTLDEDRWPSFVHAVYRGYWRDGVDIASESSLRDLLRAADFDARTVARALAGNDDPAVKAELRRRTDEAVARAVFGAPTVFLTVPDRDRPYMFFGQDRLHLLRAALAGWRPERGAPTEAQLGATRLQPANKPADQTADGPSAALRTVHFFYDFSSPFAYLASTQIERIAASANARLRWRPMLLGAVFRDLGTPNVPLNAMAASKRAYQLRDLAHWAAYWDQPFVFARTFPQRTITALRLALLAGERIADLSHALFRVPWVEDGDLNDRATLARVLAAGGFDPAEMLEKTQEPAVKKMLFDNTAEAVERGVFGAPTCIVEGADGGEDALFWGQDRLELVEVVAKKTGVA